MKSLIVPVRRPRFKAPYKLEGQKLREHGIYLDKFENYTSDSPELEESINSVVDDLFEEYCEQFPIAPPNYTFRDFLEDALSTIKWRLEVDIPEKLKRNIVTREDAERACYVLYKSFEKIKRYITTLVF